MAAPRAALFAPGWKLELLARDDGRALGRLDHFRDGLGTGALHEALVFNLPPPSASPRLLVDSARPDLDEHEIGDRYAMLPHGAAIVAWESEAEQWG